MAARLEAPDGFTALMIATCAYYALVEDVAQTLPNGVTPLMAASQHGRLEGVRALLKAGADVARMDYDGSTALMAASDKGHVECVRALLEAGADAAQARPDGSTALLFASQVGHLDCVRALLEAGSDVARAKASGETALMAASRRGHLECVRALLEARADVAQARLDGATALLFACQEGRLECVRALLEAGADVAQATEDGMTALISSSCAGQLDCVRALLEAGANVAQADHEGLTALMLASQNGHVECARALLEAGADVMQLDRRGGYSALERACQSLCVLQLLCAYAPSRDAVRSHPMPENFVVPECVQWLEATRRWSSRLHHFEFLSLERVRALIVEEGADVHAGDGKAGAPTPLSLAAARLLRDADDGRAALIVRAAAPWSPATHALFPSAAKARAVELLRIGWLLARRVQHLCADASPVEVAFRDVWLGHAMPLAIERH